MTPRPPALSSTAFHEPTVPRCLVRFPDTPLVHLGIGLLVVALYALSAIPAITAERRRVPTRIGLAAASADSRMLRIAFILNDAEGRSIVAPGTTEVTVSAAQPSGLMTEPLLVPVASFRVRTPRSRFVPGFNPWEGRREMVCRLKGIPLGSIPALAYAAQAQSALVVRIAYFTDAGQSMGPVEAAVALDVGRGRLEGAVR